MRVPAKDVIYTNSADAQQPRYDHRCEQEPNPVGAIMLKGKQGYQYDTCNWNFYICRTLEILGRCAKLQNVI